VARYLGQTVRRQDVNSIIAALARKRDLLGTNECVSFSDNGTFERR